MDFAAAWDALEINDTVTVSNGKPPPSTNTAGAPYKAWRSNNFTGTLTGKIDGDWRVMDFAFTSADFAPDAVDNTVTFHITEGGSHTFAEPA